MPSMFRAHARTWFDGRFYADALPFFQKHLAFAENNEHSQR